MVRMWKKGDWRAGKKGGKRSDFGLATFDRVVTEQKAQDLFLAFVGQAPPFPLVDCADMHVDAIFARSSAR